MKQPRQLDIVKQYFWTVLSIAFITGIGELVTPFFSVTNVTRGRENGEISIPARSGDSPVGVGDQGPTIPRDGMIGIDSPLGQGNRFTFALPSAERSSAWEVEEGEGHAA